MDITDKDSLEEMYKFYSKLNKGIIKDIKETINLKDIQETEITGYVGEYTKYESDNFIIIKTHPKEKVVNYQLFTNISKANLLTKKDKEYLFNFVDTYFKEYKQWLV